MLIQIYNIISGIN